MLQTYLIVETSSYEDIVFSEIDQTSPSLWRKSSDGSKAVISWEGTEPSFVSSLANTEGPYTHSEVLSVLDVPEWNGPKAPLI